MKHFALFAATGLLVLGACSPQKTETMAPAAPEQAVPTQAANENAELANGEKPSEFDQHITDPKVAAGEEIYERSCAGCHDSGTGGAPKPGNREEWTARIPLGLEALTQKSIDGYEGKKGAMPPKGGNEELSRQEVANAVLYMVERSK
ncbi:MAG: cytochrome c5 family protein [Chlorobiaceae bacterium]|nr:cytochrome c5 family protein [Chlorobiaceae bacterium]